MYIRESRKVIKYCRRCEKDKESTEFYKDNSKDDGLCYYCKDCVKKKCLEYSHSPNGKEKRRSYNKEWSKENAYKKNASSRARQIAKLKAIPSWADLDQIKGLYRQAKDLTVSTGIDHQVDHIVPLRSQTVCGLHVETNLQVIQALPNRIKGNRFWPDCP